VVGLEVLFDGGSRMMIVAGRERRVLGKGELDVAAHVVGGCGLEGVEGGLEPVLGDGHVGVDEREEVVVGVAYTGVSGGVWGLDLGFVDEAEVIVVFFIGVDDLRGAVGGAVVDDDYFMVGGLGEEGLEGGLDADGIVIDGDDDRNRQLRHITLVIATIPSGSKKSLMSIFCYAFRFRRTF
jgi:hypothetical protein